MRADHDVHPVVMTALAYRRACLHAKPFLAEVLDSPYDLNQAAKPEGGVGVYIACNATGAVDYVGSVHRPNDPEGAARRVAEHLYDPGRHRSWRFVWWIPMHASASMASVRKAEGMVGALLRPTRNLRLPA
jgi:hypothetical protein